MSRVPARLRGGRGRDLDREAFRWWLTLATLRWGVICRFQAERHLSGQTRSVELAAIGRRVCETEWDVLDLLAGAHAVSSTDGRPTAAELVAAVADFLDDRRPAGHRGQVSFHARVAANVLRIVERELLDETAGAVAALDGLGFADETPGRRHPRRDLDHRADEVCPCLRTLVRRRLEDRPPGI